MEPIFENETNYTKELYDKYIKFHVRKFAIKGVISDVLLIVFLIFLAIFSFKQLQWRIIFIILAIAVFIYFNRRRTKKAKEQYKDVAEQKKSLVKYSFYTQYFKTEYKDEVKDVSYLKIKKVFELNDRYYLYMNRNHAYVVLKDGFTKGTIEDFRKFFKTKGVFKIKKVKKH